MRLVLISLVKFMRLKLCEMMLGLNSITGLESVRTIVK